MMLFTLFTSLLIWSPFHITARVLRPRQSEDGFSLYAYGEGIGGLGVFYDNDLAYVVEPSVASTLNATAIIFTFADSTLTAHPASNITTHLNGTLFVPTDDDAQSHQVGFLNSEHPANSTDGIATSGWFFYGHVLALDASDDGSETLFSACVTATEGLYILNWEASGDLEDADSCVFVTLKDTAPSATTDKD